MLVSPLHFTFTPFALLACLAVPAPAQTMVWYQHLVSTPGANLIGTSMAFDSQRGVHVVHGYENSSSFTWEFNGSSWALRASGAPRRYGKMVWHKRLGAVIGLFEDSNQTLSTHKWNGTTWTPVPTAVLPPWRTDFALAQDSTRDVSVLFGGHNGNGASSETWEFDGTNWRQRSSGGPPPRHGIAMAFDSARNRMVLFGGWNDKSSPVRLYTDTWEWDGVVWREHFGVPGPTTRHGYMVVYDSLRQRTLLYGGRHPSSGLWSEETWEWDGTAWTRLTPRGGALGIRESLGLAFAYDPNRRLSLLQAWVWANNTASTMTWSLFEATNPDATFTAFGTGCAGSAGTPTLGAQSGSLPKIGGSFTVIGRNVPNLPLSAALGILGGSKTQWGSVPLPLDLGPIGAPTCSLLVSPDFMFPLLPSSGQVTWSLPVPGDPTLVGYPFWQQLLMPDPAANTLGVVVANAGEARIGV